MIKRYFPKDQNEKAIIKNLYIFGHNFIKKFKILLLFLAFIADYEYKVKISLFFKRNIFKNNVFAKYTVKI